MSFLAVLAEQVLSRLLVVALSAPYRRRTMHRPDMSRLLPFAGKILSAVSDSTCEPCLLPLYAISRLIVSVLLVNDGATLQFAKLERAMCVRLHLHSLGQRVVVLPRFLVWDL